MTDRRGNKRTYIQISSSSSGEEEDEEEEEEEDDQSESESEEYDGNDDDECSASTSCDDDGDGEESGSDDEDDESDDDKGEESAHHDSDESRCNRIIRLLRERSELQELNLKDCRAYLRKHGLRITGTKAECTQRIMEHWRIKDGNAEALYPRSSFTINCTGDVCKGDTVLFTQKVYKKFDKVTRSGNSIGKRTVAGRVVKESYGAAKQQHTFTVEVLWSKGIKKLPPLFPLLVKGRNLYKLRTFRQRWKNEMERSKVIAEKHKRGAAARLMRAKMKTKKACPKNGGVQRQKHSHPKGNSAGLEKGKRAKRCGKAPIEQAKSSIHFGKAPAVARANLKNSYSSAPKSSRSHQTVPHHERYRDLTTHTCTFPQNFHQPQMPYHHHQWGPPLHFPPMGSTSSRMGFPHFRPYVDSSVMPLSQHQGSHHGFYPHHAHLHPSWVFEPSNLKPSPEFMNTYGLSKMYGQRR